jgi:tRNA nucleotidyltransferase/poly(A) polymerase
MLEIYSIRRSSAAMPADQHIRKNDVEETIFQFIREACAFMPQRPVARVAGGWVRDKLLGRPSDDIDVSADKMKGKDFGEGMLAYSRTPEAIEKYGRNVVGEVKDTEERDEQLKKMAPAFTHMFGLKIDLVPLRGIEIYEPGNRNPKTINLPELTEIARQPGGIPAYIKTQKPELLSKLSGLNQQEQNDPLKVLPILDAHRRDLTINSLFYNINTDGIEDLTSRGFNDLATMTLDTPLEPSATFTDDPLRVLRVVRFHSKFSNSKITPRVLQAMTDPTVQFQITRRIADPQETMGIVVERTATEFRKLMMGSQPEAGLRILYETGLLAKMLNLPKEFQPLGMDQRNAWHSMTVIDHSLTVLKHVNRLCKEYGFSNEQRMMMNMGALGHDLGKLDPRSHVNKPDGTRGYYGDPNHPRGVVHELASQDVWLNFAKAMQLSNEETDFVSELISGHMKPHKHVEDNVSDKALRRYLRENPNWVFQYVHAMADAMSKTPDEPPPESTEPYRRGLERLRQLAPNADTFGNQPAQQDLLNGQEIMNLVGLPPKPPKGLLGYIEVVKEKVRDAQDGNPNLTKQDAIQIVQTMINSGELNAYRV